MNLPPQTSIAIRARIPPDWLLCLLLIVATVTAKAALTPINPLNHDVTFLAWTAEQVLGSLAYGRDIYDVNPPLAFMLYSPAAFLAPWTGYDPAIRLTVILLSALSIAAFWQVADRHMRVPLTIALALFFILAFPNHFAQREQFAFLLCAPYVAGASKGRGWALLIGLMAGVGFIIKPHFLIPLAMLVAFRRRLGTEEVAIGVAGVTYALAIVIFFQSYLFETLPAAAATYWAVYHPLRDLLLPTLAILGAALSLFAAGARQPSAQPYLIATIGFTAAAMLQRKGFEYHFIPAWGFLALYITAMRFNPKPIVGAMAGLFLLVEAAALGGLAYRWHLDEQRHKALANEVRREIDGSTSFASLVPQQPYPAFPDGFYTQSRFQGIAIAQMFIPAVAHYAVGEAAGDSRAAERLALDQAKRELAREPELVFTWAVNYPVKDKQFDILAWLNRDEGFKALWQNYHHTRTIGHLHLYRRK